jgi:high-affinity iron transporter
MPFLSSALQSAAILLREGIEALLVVAALATFLHKAQATRAIRALYAGAGAAVLASLVAAVLFQIFLNGAHDDRLEAVVMIVAALLMFYMSGWLFLKQDGRAWLEGLKRDAGEALGAGAALPIAGIAFLAVFREGAETVLFLHALAASEGGWNLGLAAGLVGAAAVLAALFHAMRVLALRLPLRPLFIATSAFLFVMGLRFVGGAIQELQEQALLPVHFANDFSDVLLPLGLNATWEALGTQGVILALAAASLAMLWTARQPGRA